MITMSGFPPTLTISLIGDKGVYTHIADTSHGIDISKNEQGLVLELDKGRLKAIGDQNEIGNEEVQK